MIKTIIKLSGVLVLSGLACSANAATVSLAPDALETTTGGHVNVDLMLSAADIGPGLDGFFSGQAAVSYDPLEVQFDGFVFNDPAQQLSAPVVSAGSGSETVTLGFFDGLESGSIGTFNFTVLAPAQTTVQFGVADGDDFFGSFAKESPANLPFAPTFVGADVSVVPLPAAFWLFGSALAGLGWLRRKQAA